MTNDRPSASKTTMTTPGFLAFWYLACSIGPAAAQSWLWEHSTIGYLPEAWVFHMFTWIGATWIAFVGNHMATGTWFLRGLKDWP